MSPTCPRSEVLCDIARCAADRLLSVGAGEVLPDLLDPGNFLPSVRPTRIFRQASRSGVVTNAHRINPGEYPQLRGLAEFFLFHADGADTRPPGRPWT